MITMKPKTAYSIARQIIRFRNRINPSEPIRPDLTDCKSWQLEDVDDVYQWLMGFNNVKDDEFDSHRLCLNIPYTGHGDYCGGVVERSNFEVIEEEYENSEENEFGQYLNSDSGHYSYRVMTIDLLVCLESYDEDFWHTVNEFVERVEALQNYPCFDDEHVSHIEMEQEWEDWKDFARREFMEAITNHLDDENQESLIEYWESYEDDNDRIEIIDDFYCEKFSGGTICFEMESAFSGYFSGLSDINENTEYSIKQGGDWVKRRIVHWVNYQLIEMENEGACNEA